LRRVTRWSLFTSGAPSRTRSVVSLVAVVPLDVLLVKLMRDGWLVAVSVSVAAVITVILVDDGDGPMSAGERRLAARAVLCGQRTGDSSLDAYAIEILLRRRRVGQLAESTTMSIVMLGVLAAPVVASISYGAWWLIFIPFDVAVAARFVPYLTLDIDENIRRLEGVLAG
jgi:hypothetical protein